MFKAFSIACLIVYSDKLYVRGYIGTIFPVFLFSPTLSKTGFEISIFPNALLTLP